MRNAKFYAEINRFYVDNKNSLQEYISQKHLNELKLILNNKKFDKDLKNLDLIKLLQAAAVANSLVINEDFELDEICEGIYHIIPLGVQEGLPKGRLYNAVYPEPLLSLLAERMARELDIAIRGSKPQKTTKELLGAYLKVQNVSDTLFQAESGAKEVQNTDDIYSRIFY